MQGEDGRHAQRRGIGVVGRLVQVEVVVGADGLIVAQRPAQQLQGPIGQHLVDVHVGRGAGAALQGIDDDVLVEPAGDHFLAGRFDGGELGVVPSAQFVIGSGRGQLHRAVGVDQAAMHRPTGQRKVFDRPQRVDAPQRVGRHVAGSQQVGFRAVFHCKAATSGRVSRFRDHWSRLYSQKYKSRSSFSTIRRRRSSSCRFRWLSGSFSISRRMAASPAARVSGEA